MIAHWITNECERKLAALACKRIKGTHSFHKIAEIMEEIHLEYNLTWNKIVGTVIDNGSNFVKAFKIYGIKTSVLDFEMEAENMSDSDQSSSSASESDENPRMWTEKLSNHIRCGSHTLNLCASADLKKTLIKNSALSNIHDQVLGKCNKLWKAAQRPKSAEIIENIIGHTLTRPGETRWNSLYNALQQIMEIREKCGQLFKELGFKNPLNDREFEYVQEHLKCTKPIAEALDILQEEKNTFYGILIPCLALK
ncbi:hypothetical protein RF55_9583 [Lasius niger]|uniref:Zinc finger bed domain-containing protein 4-like protein n=1 Tax=Lasius niger TaxID=67767 RepID=A0A0J7NDP6_LASNI|nr:hypothetical protein RF55_9583 [Lasius niger]